MTRGARKIIPRGLLGTGLAATLALALLALGCVFAATAGPREALATRTQALRQTLGSTSALEQAIAVSSTWNGVASALAQANFGGGADVNITQAQFGEITRQLRGDFNRGVVRLAPAGQDWASMISNPHTVTTVLPAVKGVEVHLEIGYRDPITKYLRLVAGRLPGTPPAASAPASGVNGPAKRPPGGYTQTIEVLVSQQTARAFGLHPGSKLKISGPSLQLSGRVTGILLDVTGIMAPRDPASTFWTADPTVLTPDFEMPRNSAAFWVGEVLAGPSEILPVQQAFGPEGLALAWELPLDVSSLNGDQAQPLYDALVKTDAQSPPLAGDVALASAALTADNGLLQPLAAFIATAQSVDALLWLLYVSLAVAGIVTLLLAARMVAMRRSAELTMRRARGASLRQIAWTALGGAAIACVPAAVVAVLIATAWIPGPLPPGGWWPSVATFVVAVCAPAMVAVWQQRLPRRRSRDRRRPRVQTRLVVEATACLAAIAGVIVFRQQGSQPGSSVDLYTSAAPVLVAIPAVIVVLRVYPLVLRAMLRGSARSTGATAFLGLARAARAALTPALPAFALVLALTIAAFAGMVRDAVTSGEFAASWQAAGADVSVSTGGPFSGGVVVTPAALRAVAAVPGVTRAAAVWQSAWTAPGGQQVTGLAVDPAQYAALVAGTQTFPQIQPGLLTAGTPQPVLASPQAAADLGSQEAGTLTTESGVAPLRVRVAGVLAGTPALPAGGAWVIMPATAIRGQTGQIPFNEVLLTGANIDSARLSAVLRAQLPGAVTTYRSDILKGLSGAPLQHGTFVLFALALIAAAALGLAVMLLELALGAAERETTLARLAAMGLGEGQRVRMVVLEVVPALIAAALAAGVCAWVLPRLVAPSLDLSVFTGSVSAVALSPDVTSFGVPLAGLAVAAIVALGVEIRSARRRGVASSVRAGE